MNKKKAPSKAIFATLSHEIIPTTHQSLDTDSHLIHLNPNTIVCVYHTKTDSILSFSISKPAK